MEASGALRTLAVSLDEDRERHSLAGFWPSLWLGRNQSAGNPARFFHHARKGQSGHRGIRHDGLRAGHRQRRHHHVGGQAGNFELIVMLPVMAYNLLQSIELLAAASTNFAVRCVEGIEANEERCQSLIEASLAMCTALAPEIGL